MRTPSQIGRPRAILFDHDGVLAMSEPLHWAAWGELMRELELPFEEAHMRAQVGKTGPEILTALLDRHKPGWSPAQYDVHALAWRKNDFYLASMHQALRPYPGVLDGLHWLRAQGIRAAVVSNAKGRELRSALDVLGIAPLVDAIFSRDDVPQPKPNPQAYLTAAAHLGFEHTECVVVEDSPPGLASALLGGIPAAAVTTNFPADVLRAPIPGRPDLAPVWIGGSMEDFFTWVGGLRDFV